jgi:hypothetical protein
MARRAGTTLAMSATSVSTAGTAMNGDGIDRAHLIEEAPDEPRHDERDRQADGDAAERQPQAARDHEAEHGRPIGADGHADADLARALADQVRQHAVNADCGKRERERREQTEQQSREPRR